MTNEDKIWGMIKKYAPEIKQIIIDNSKYFIHIRLATEEEDTKKSTDLVGEINVRFAIRVRETNFRDFTIRSQSKYGGRTEIDKIRDGNAECDYYFYFWGNSENKISDWILVDMNKFKHSELATKEKATIPNGDGTGFIPYSIEELREIDCYVDGTL
jgi:hypothetical protein